jgi:hypothetical protein
MIGNIVSARPRHAWLLGAGVSVDSLIPKLPGIATSTVASVGATTGAIAAGSALSIALPIIGIALGAVLGSLFAAHEARVKGATTENAVLNSLIPTMVSAIEQVFQAANAGTITADQAVSAMQALQQQYWQEVAQVETGPGQAGGPSKCVAQTPTPNAGTTCDKSCTASCCIGCNTINEWCYNAIQAFQAGGGSGPLPWNSIVGNKYGLTNFSPPSGTTYTPPADGSTGAIDSLPTSAAGVVSDLTSGTVFGVPTWLIAAGVVAWMVL